MNKFLLILIFFLTNGNIFPQSSVSIDFKPSFNKNILLKDSLYVTKNNDTIKFETLKFYISSIKIKFKNGYNFNEKNSYHLLNIDDANSMKIILKNLPNNKINSIAFNLGIDSITNTSGAMKGDLDPMNGMYWAWQSGYINFKLEGNSPSSITRKNQFQFHIGGYLSPFYAMRKIELPIGDIDNNSIRINMKLDKLFEEISLKNFHSIMTPSTESMRLADILMKIFSVSN